MNYLVVVPVTAYPISDKEFAMESAFCDHLKTLLDMLTPPFDTMVIAGIHMPDTVYNESRRHLGVLNADTDRISFVPLFHRNDGTLRFWLWSFPKALVTMYRLARKSALIHAGTSHELPRPIELPSLIFGALLGKKTISVTDMDLREDAKMNYLLGRWSFKTYALCRYVYDPIRALQHRLVARICDLVLMKGEKLVADYGRGRPNVRGIWDPGFHADHIVGPVDLEKKLATLKDPNHPLELVYFGRYIYYKGVDRCIEAVARAKADSPSRKIRLNLMGSGEEEARLRQLVCEHKLESSVRFHQPVKFGQDFFAKLRPWHLMLATPLSVDTPRSTWDAIASSLPLLAFDTEFYAGLAETTGVIDVVPWPSTEALAERIAYYADHRDALIPMIHRCIEVARDNTQEQWLNRRVQWTRELLN
jgi:glycosyltransferase involved in cell wall biosynthesis